MADMIVNLSRLEPYEEYVSRLLRDEGIKIARAVVPDKFGVVQWVEKNSTPYAAGECDVCFANKPVSCFIATKGKEVIGYACYDAIAPDFFGPTKVLEAYQGKGIGKALLLRTLHAMSHAGYAYAIIGGVGPAEFYKKTVNAVWIADSIETSIYDDFISHF